MPPSLTGLPLLSPGPFSSTAAFPIFPFVDPIPLRSSGLPPFPEDPRHPQFGDFFETFSDPLHSAFPTLTEDRISFCRRRIFDAGFSNPPFPLRKKNRRVGIASLMAEFGEVRSRSISEEVCPDGSARAPFNPSLSSGISVESGESDSEEVSETRSSDSRIEF
jgi:hypothetical protein